MAPLPSGSASATAASSSALTTRRVRWEIAGSRMDRHGVRTTAALRDDIVVRGRLARSETGVRPPGAQEADRLPRR
jgi:hypothetical protein